MLGLVVEWGGGSGFVSGRVDGGRSKTENCKKWRKSAVLVLFCADYVWFCFVWCFFLVLMHGIGGGDRFSEIVRSVSLVVICGYNTRRAKKTSFVAGGASTAGFFMRMNHKGLPGKT